MKKLAFLLITLLLVEISSAQKYVDLAKFHYANTPQTSFDSLGVNETTNVEDIELKLIKEEAFDCFSSSKASDVEDAIANFYGASASDLKVSTTTLTKKSSESCKSFDKFD